MSENTQLAVLPPAALSRKVEPAAWNAIKEIYDGASDEKIGLVLDYCAARKLDPLKKPVHIVSTYSQKRGQFVETIWPSIGELRITAHRTGLFAGMDETRFGPTMKAKLGSMEIEFPEWAQVTLYRIMVKGDFSTRVPVPGPRVYFVEAYASRKKDDATPNAMWSKRTWGQLEKCAEAAALRRAFPEEAGNQPTAEEMAGRTVDDDLGGGAEVRVGPTAEVVSGNAGSATVATEVVSDAPAPKRAAVPRKKGAAAIVPPAPATAPTSTPDPDPAPAAEPPAPAEQPVQADALTVESEQPAPAPAPEPPPPAPDPTPKADPKPEPKAQAEKPAPAQEPEWPRVVKGFVTETREAAVKGNAKYNTVTVARLDGGTTVIRGVEVPLTQLGRVIFDPERPGLRAFAKVSDELCEFTLEQQPSASDPTRMNILVTKAVVADVAM